MKRLLCHSSFFAYLLFAAMLCHLPPSTKAAAPSDNGTAPQGHYKNFAVAVYLPVVTVQSFAEPGRLEAEWELLGRQIKIDKVYLETHRGREVVDEALLERVKKFFVDRGVRVAGGITFTDRAAGFVFTSFCYTNAEDRAFVKKVTELTARHFDEIILDDFTFVTTKHETDVAAKGGRSWAEFRMALMNEVARTLIVGPAKAVNPKAKVIIKYPNWYEHFQNMGFDLQEGPKIYDGIYTGTETRDPSGTDQFLQQYESYQVLRYFDNIAPGRNGGGWVDTFSTRYVDRYAEQLWDTLFAKTREITLFCWPLLLRPVALGDRSAWQGLPTSLDTEAMVKRIAPDSAGAPSTPLWACAASFALERADAVVGHLGKPLGIASYRPPHGIGEDFLHNYFGMLGIPIELSPNFPEEAGVVLLTEDAKEDPELVARIKKQLNAGKTVVITSGLYAALHGKGIEEIVELQLSARRFVADNFVTRFLPVPQDSSRNETLAKKTMLYPQIGYITNDAWALVMGMADETGYPILLQDAYGKAGHLYVWTMPDNPRHLYQLPVPIVSAIKDHLMTGFPVRLDGPSQVALYAYDNDTLVVESYLPEATHVKIAVLGAAKRLRDLNTGEQIEALPQPSKLPPWEAWKERRAAFEVAINPHSFRGFIVER